MTLRAALAAAASRCGPALLLVPSALASGARHAERDRARQAAEGQDADVLQDEAARHEVHGRDLQDQQRPVERDAASPTSRAATCKGTYQVSVAADATGNATGASPRPPARTAKTGAKVVKLQ